MRLVPPITLGNCFFLQRLASSSAGRDSSTLLHIAAAVERDQSAVVLASPPRSADQRPARQHGLYAEPGYKPLLITACSQHLNWPELTCNKSTQLHNALQTVYWIPAAWKGWIEQTYRKIIHTQNTKKSQKRLQWSRASASRLDWLQRNYSVNRRQSARAVNTGSVNRALSEIRQLKLNEITFGPVYAMARCPSVCLSVWLQVGFVSKWLDESSLFLAWRLPSTYPRLCCKEIWISADTSGHDVSRLYYYRAQKACAMEVKS